MQDKDVPEGVASTWLSAFWLTFTFSRLIAALSVPPDTDHFVVMGLAVSCILFSLGFVFSRTATSTFALVVTAGLILGPIVPILIAFPVGHVVLTLQGRSIGLFFCIGRTGWAIFLFLAGSVAKKSNVQKAFSAMPGAPVLWLCCV